MAMLYKEYDEAEVMEMMRRDAKEEGIEEGIEKGIEQGIEQKGREDIISLARYQRSLDPGMSEEEAIASAERILGGQK